MSPAKALRKALQRDEKSFTTANLCQNHQIRDTFSAKLEQRSSYAKRKHMRTEHANLQRAAPPIKEYPLAKGGNAKIARLQRRRRP